MAINLLDVSEVEIAIIQGEMTAVPGRDTALLVGILDGELKAHYPFGTKSVKRDVCIALAVLLPFTAATFGVVCLGVWLFQGHSKRGKQDRKTVLQQANKKVSENTALLQ